MEKVTEAWFHLAMAFGCQVHALGLQESVLLRLGHVSRDVEAEMQGDLTLLIAKQTWQLVRLQLHSYSRAHHRGHKPLGHAGICVWWRFHQAQLHLMIGGNTACSAAVRAMPFI